MIQKHLGRDCRHHHLYHHHTNHGSLLLSILYLCKYAADPFKNQVKPSHDVVLPFYISQNGRDHFANNLADVRW